jgi:hypothetical protein
MAPRGPSGEESRPLSPHEALFVEALASGLSLKEAAKTASISYRTGKRWHRTERIASAVERRQTENFAAARAILVAASADAARYLTDIAGKGTPDAARVAACKAIIHTAADLSEWADIDERLRAVEGKHHEETR